MAKLKDRGWGELDRSEKIASVLYPSLTSEKRQQEMTKIASGESKKAPAKIPLLRDRERGHVSKLGGVATSGAKK